MNTRRIPNFYCIGAQKAGTTTLHELLKQHPDIYLPEIKEAHYFHKDHLYNKGFQWYLDMHFSTVNDEKMIGSITPEYLYFENCAERIYQTFGSDMKFIVILRNPVDRAYSHYKMSKFRGYETLSFPEAINQEKVRIKKSLHNKIHFSYLDRGYYYKQIKRYLKFYPADNFLIINFEKEFRKDLNKTVNKIFKFIGVDEFNINFKIHENAANEAVFPLLNQILVNKPKLLNKITHFLPKGIKRNSRKFLNDINKKKHIKNELNHDFKLELIFNYYRDDITDLKHKMLFNNNWMNN